MKPQHALWSSVKHCAFCWVLPQHFIKNNCHDDETDDDVKRFLDFSKVSRCRSELLPGRDLDAWNCVPLHLLTLNHRKKYLLSITSLPIYWTCFVKWTFHSWCLENMPLTHFFSIFFNYDIYSYLLSTLLIQNRLQNIEHLSSTAMLSAAQTHTVLVLKPCPSQTKFRSRIGKRKMLLKDAWCINFRKMSPWPWISPLDPSNPSTDRSWSANHGSLTSSTSSTFCTSTASSTSSTNTTNSNTTALIVVPVLYMHISSLQTSNPPKPAQCECRWLHAWRKRIEAFSSSRSVGSTPCDVVKASGTTPWAHPMAATGLNKRVAGASWVDETLAMF